MTSPQVPDTRFWSQWQVVREAALARGIKLDNMLSPGKFRRALSPNLIFEKDALLVRRVHQDTVLENTMSEVVPDRGVRRAPDEDHEDDLVLVRIDDREASVPATVNRLENGPVKLPMRAATPHHLISICPTCLCPATEPLPSTATSAPVPAPAEGSTAGRDVRVTVVDTGIWPDFKKHRDNYPWLAGAADGQPVEGTPRVGPVIGNPKPKPEPGTIPEYFGHGVFVAGVLRCVAPGTDVFVSNALPWAGAVMEIDLGQHLVDVLDGTLTGGVAPQIISLSAGGQTLSDLQHAGLRMFLEKLREPDRTTLLVAAAGNDGETTPFYPAANAPEMGGAVVSVGALRQDGKGRACFSNHGDWVDVYAPGERMVNAFPTGKYTVIDPPALDADGGRTCRYYDHGLYPGCTCLDAMEEDMKVDFARMAEWSGTSYATPYVSGLIAARMSDTGGQDARVAARDLLAGARAISDDADGVSLRVLP